ncbi:MAG: hypothetical protein AAGL68_08800 [Pseudomonadota bacterium]
MKLAKGPRPAGINAFAAILLTLAAWNLVTALFDLPAQQETLAALGLGLEWNRDWTIVASSAWFTIELIPIALVWLMAKAFARWLIVGMAAIKTVLVLTNLPMLYAFPGVLAGLSISLCAVALLFTRGANEWFAPQGEVDAHEFD